MSVVTVSEKLKTLALDLRKQPPRSPRATLGGYIIAARVLDKCRAVLNGTNGEYNFNCPLDQIFLKFAGIDANEFQNLVAAGASDEEVGEWIQSKAIQKDRQEVILWNNEWRYRTLRELEPGLQVFFEDYIQANIPAGRVVYFMFDVFDLEEKRL